MGEARKLKKNYADEILGVNLTKSYKRNQTTESLKEDFNDAYDKNKKKDRTIVNPI